jgi:hypothetical protein
MSAPALLDDFNRANENPLTTSNYGGMTSASLLRLISNQCAGVSAGNVLNDMSWNTVFPADQIAQVKVPVVDTLSGTYIRLYLRSSSQTSAPNGYMMQWQNGVQGLQIYRMTAGAYTLLATASGAVVANNDVVMFQVDGYVLTVYQNTASVLSYDASGDVTKYNNSGFIGLGGLGSVFRFDDFTGGRLGYIDVPFLHASAVHDLFSIFGSGTGTGPGNGGETDPVELAPTGTSVTATLSANLTTTGSLLSLTGDSGLPDTFCVTIDSEVMYVAKLTAGSYRIRRRGTANTTPATHTAGASVTWNDTYDMAIGATDNADASFTANILSTGSFTYYGWAIAYDSSQAYLSGSRYPTHVSSVLGVFPSGGTTNKLDAAQPNKISVPAAVSDNCPAALAVPARISGNIVPGDVALVRYQNPEASTLTLGSRACSLQTWYGMKRVSTLDVDVTLTNTAGTIVDGTVEGTWFQPVTTGIDPATGGAISNAYYTSVTLPGANRTFTHSGGTPNYSEHGWPICCLAVRNGTRRVPYWASYDWHNFSFVYSGFATDATYAQMVINRNGITNPDSPTYALPGTQDISGPDALWDDNTYYFGAAWYVAIFNAPFLLSGPTIGGVGGEAGTSGPVASVSFPVSGGGGTASFPGPIVEGGSGGGISPPSAQNARRFQASIF